MAAKKLIKKFNNTRFTQAKIKTFGLIKPGKNPNAATPKMQSAIKKAAMFPSPAQQRAGEKKGFYMP